MVGVTTTGGTVYRVAVLKKMRTTVLSHKYMNYGPLTLVSAVIEGKCKNAYHMGSLF